MPLKACPECGASLDGRDPRKHAAAHWPPEVPDEKLPDAAADRRAKLLGRKGD